VCLIACPAPLCAFAGAPLTLGDCVKWAAGRLVAAGDPVIANNVDAWVGSPVGVGAVPTGDYTQVVGNKPPFGEKIRGERITANPPGSSGSFPRYRPRH
jgi:hypothetical protein